MGIVESGASRKEGESSDKLLAQIESIKKKYGIKSWPPQKEIMKLEVQTLREELESLTDSIENLGPRLEELLKNEEKSNEVLTQLGHDPSTLGKSIRKNILRKYLLKNRQSEEVKRLEVL